MKLGDTGNADALPFGKPLDGVRVLALEQMQALPYATQLLARLGADVVKIESTSGGDLGRGSLPGMPDPEGRNLGATFLRNNLGKRSMCVDLKSPEGRQIVLDLAPKFDIVAENFKGGALKRMGLGYDDIAAVHPACVYVSVSGFGNIAPTPYDGWPAYAAIAEAMSGIYDYRRPVGVPPTPSPVGALGDIGTALFATIGLLAALRHRDQTGIGQYVDVAMFDSMVAMTDIVVNFWSMGAWPKPGQGMPMIIDGFEASNGWFIVQCGREHEFERLANLVGHPEWLTDERLSTRQGWRDHMDDILRPGIKEWAADKTNLEACFELAKAGVAAGPCLTPEQVVNDPHLAERNMVVEIPNTAGGDPVLTPGNPIKMTKMADGPETRMPWVGEHTDSLLADELGLDEARIAELREKGVVA